MLRYTLVVEGTNTSTYPYVYAHVSMHSQALQEQHAREMSCLREELTAERKRTAAQVTYIHTYPHTYPHTCIHTYIHTYLSKTHSHSITHSHTHIHTHSLLPQLQRERTALDSSQAKEAELRFELSCANEQFTRMRVRASDSSLIVCPH